MPLTGAGRAARAHSLLVTPSSEPWEEQGARSDHHHSTQGDSVCLQDEAQSPPRYGWPVEDLGLGGGEPTQQGSIQGGPEAGAEQAWAERCRRMRY